MTENEAIETLWRIYSKVGAMPGGRDGTAITMAITALYRQRDAKKENDKEGAC